MKIAFLLSFLYLAGSIVIAQTLPGANGTATPISVVSDQRYPTLVAVDEDSVYWVSDTSTVIKRVSKNGGNPTTLVTGQKNIQRILPNGDNLYFNTDDEIKQVSKKGGALLTLAKFIGKEKLYLEVDESNVYFVNSSSGEERLMKVSQGGGEPVVLASKIQAISGLASDGTDVYWADYADDTLKRVSVDGGKTTTFASCGGPNAIALDTGAVYCAHGDGKGVEIIGFRKSDGGIISRAIIADAIIVKMAIDERNLYVMAMAKGIYKIGKGGGKATLLIRLNEQVVPFTVDNTDIYWADSRRGSIMRLRK